MPKQIYKIFQFHGGLSNDADPRDIAENELADLKNVAVDKLGRIVVLGDVNTAYKTIASSPAITVSGGGVKAVATDYDGLLDSPTGDSNPPGQVYWLVEKSGAITGLGEDNEAGTIAATSLAGSAMYFADGALRIYSSDHDVAVTPQWRGRIEGKMLGSIDSDAGQNGNIWNSTSGSTSAEADIWYTKDAQITGCFPETGISSSESSHAEVQQVGHNLIMGSRLCKSQKANYQANGNVVDVFGFANEDSRTGVGPGDTDGGSTGMLWGLGMYYTEAGDGTGSWMPNGNDTYQFWCTTIYDGVQESLPQLFTMYPTGPQANQQQVDAGAGVSNHYGPTDVTEANNKYELAVPELSLQFGDGGTGTDVGKNIYIELHPIIKWCDAAYGSTTDWSSSGTGTLSGIYYNFGGSTVGANGAGSGNPRITALRTYWSSSEDGFTDKWLLFEFDFVKGIRSYGSGGGGGSYVKIDWTNAMQDAFTNGHYYWYHHCHGQANSAVGLRFYDPPKFLRYDALNGHSSNDIIVVDSFKTSVVANRRTYIGNVKIDGIVYGDRMLKSPPNQFDKFPVEAGRVDVVINDGDEIVALFEHADRILQFKKNILFIINVSGGVEFLESEHKFKGITNPGAACKTDYGIAWANQNGCYIYDGQRVSDLLEKQGNRKLSLNDSGLSGKEWNTFIGTGNYHRIGYNPAKRQLIVKAGTASAAAYVFDMVTNSWTYSSGMVTDSNTGSSFINDPVDGKLLIFDDGAETFDKWVDTPASAPAITILTKDIDFGEPGLNKNVYKVRITYTGGASQNCAITYAVDGSGSFSSMSADLDYTSDTTQQVVEISPSASVTNIKSFQLKISGTAATTFEINDISVIYRIKGVR